MKWRITASESGSIERRSFICKPDTLTQARAGGPAEASETADIKQLARSAVRLGGVEADTPPKADHIHDGLGQFADGDVGACPDVDQQAVVAVLHQVDTGVGQVVHIQELAHRSAAAPDDILFVTAQLGLVRLAQQRGQDVAVGEVVVVVRAVQVGGHDAHILSPVLPVVALGQLDAGDLGDGVGLVGLLQRAGEQVVLADRLRAVARIDAARPQEHQALHTRQVCAVYQIGLDQQVLVKKISAIEVVGINTTNFGCSDKDVIGRLGLEECVNCGLVEQIQFLAGARDDVVVSACLQTPNQRTTDHPAVSGDINFGVFVIHIEISRKFQ